MGRCAFVRTLYSATGLAMTTPRPLRYRCELFGHFETQQHQGCDVRVLELSESSAFIEHSDATMEVNVGDEASLLIALPGGDPWSVRVKVMRFGRSRRDVKHARVDHVTVSALGFGLEFGDLPDEELERVRDYLELLDAR